MVLASSWSTLSVMQSSHFLLAMVPATSSLLEILALTLGRSWHHEAAVAALEMASMLVNPYPLCACGIKMRLSRCSELVPRWSKMCVFSVSSSFLAFARGMPTVRARKTKSPAVRTFVR